jgi:tetratricopeptide (TPR) repeat protein
LIPLQGIQSLYDQFRFVEAYRLSAAYWTEGTKLDRFSADELILGARLAARLGGSRLQRWLYRAAREREPTSPRVRYFTSHLRRGTLLDELRDREKKPLLDTDDPELQSSWLAGNAVLWASMRDFARAHECIERAKRYACKDGWVYGCESDVLGMEDRWDEALTAAETGWKVSQGAPYLAQSLGQSLVNLGRAREAAERLGIVADSCESYEVVVAACWHYTALADTLEGEERNAVVLRARALTERLPSLAPLADRESRSLFGRIQLDLAQLADDHEQMERSAKEVRSPFYQRVVENLRKHPGKPRIRLPYRRELQRHVTCLPTALASALGSMGVNVSADEMAAAVTYGGTSDWAAAEWLRTRGLEVRGFIVTPEIASTLIRNGIAFVLSLEADDFAHAVAIVGLDEAAGTLIVHDPNHFRTTEYLLDFLGPEAPLGPRGIAAAPLEKARLLDELLPRADVEVIAAWMSYHRALQLHGATIASAFVTDIGGKHPSHPVTRLLQATEAAEDGRTGEALAVYQELLNEFPSNPTVRARLVWTCRTLGNMALVRDTLESVVERSLLPGVESRQEWRHPPSGYVSQYADLLRFSAATRGRARALLYGVIRREPRCAEAWHVLGDMLWHEPDFEGALLAYRLASCLAATHEHYAGTYCQSLGIRGRIDEGFAWLEERVRAHGESPRAAGAWIRWIAALEEWGRPERAIAACEEAVRTHENEPGLLSYATTFFARMGRWEDAESLLARLEGSGHPALFHEAAVDVHVLKGDLGDAVRHAEAWVRESPLSSRARQVLVDQIAARDGNDAALERVERWRSENPGHDGFEELSSTYLPLTNAPSWRKKFLLRRRLKRNREDGWAWRELVSSYLQDYGSANGRRRIRLRQRIEAVIAECERTAPLDPSTLRAKALWSQLNGRRAEAVALWLESIDREPGTPFGYRNALDCASSFERKERVQVWRQLERLLLAYPGRLQVAREAIQLAAERFGIAFAEEAVTRWKEVRPEDPEVTEAAADLLLEYGHGRTGAERALAMLEPAVKRYPFHLALRFSLLQAYRKLGRFPEAEEVVREIVRRHPSNGTALVQLAWIHELAGRGDDARRVLEAAIPRDSQNVELTNALVQIHVRNRRLDEAQRVVEETRGRLPGNLYWMGRSIRSLLQCGREEEALRMAREGVTMFPQGAYLWYLLGDTLEHVQRLTAQGEIERSFRRSLELNPSLFDAADRLAMLLVNQRRFEEAEVICQNSAKRMSDPSSARGRLAWIHRQQGHKEAALEEMLKTLEAAPWYQWGWHTLMEWLTEDCAWARAIELLRTIPPEICSYASLLKERLTLLEKAGFEDGDLDLEWQQLLSDFSEDVPLHLDRHDALHDQRRFSEAAEVLRKIERLDPNDPFLCARLVDVLVREDKGEEALDVSMRVLFARMERSDWPASFAWDRLRNEGFGRRAFQRMNDSLNQGLRPTPQALFLWASCALDPEGIETPGQAPRPFWRTWFPDSGARKVLAILEGEEYASWRDGRYVARLLQSLCDYGYDDLVVQYWRNHREEVEGDVEAWGLTGRALLRMGRKQEAREFLASWRDRPGVGTWILASYVACFSGVRAESLHKVRSICAEALAELPYDNGTRYLAHVEAEACALLGDQEAFRASWEKRRALFGGVPLQGELFPEDREYLRETIPAMVRFLEQDDRVQYAVERWGLWWRSAFGDVRSRPWGRALTQVPLLFWLFLILAMSGLIVNL